MEFKGEGRGWRGAVIGLEGGVEVTLEEEEEEEEEVLVLPNVTPVGGV